MNLESTNLLVYMYKWRKPLIIVPIVAAIVAVVFSGPTFIEPLFESSVVVFPTTTKSISKSLLPQNVGSGDDVLEFGAEQEAEQLLQILHSDEIRRQIVEKYDLMRHYRIDPEKVTYPQTSLNKKIDNRISMRRTKFMSIEISVLDASPDTAAMIANDFLELLDKAKLRIQRQRATKAYEIVRREYDRVKEKIKEHEQQLRQLRAKGVHDPETQAATLTEQYAAAVLANKKTLSDKFENQLDTLAKYGSTFIGLQEEFLALKEEESKLRIKVDQAKIDMEEELPSTFVVNTAKPAERKSKPKRSIIVLITMAGSFILTLLVILSINTIREARVKQD